MEFGLFWRVEFVPSGAEASFCVVIVVDELVDERANLVVALCRGGKCVEAQGFGLLCFGESHGFREDGIIDFAGGGLDGGGGLGRLCRGGGVGVLCGRREGNPEGHDGGQDDGVSFFHSSLQKMRSQSAFC